MQVASVVIEGRVSRDMYDEHPGYAFFYTDGSREIRFPRPVSLATAKAVAECAWWREHADAAEEADDEYDGQFWPVGVVLRSPDNAVVQSFTSGQWVTEFEPPEVWPDLLARAKAADSEAAFESGWDNFSTAEGLRASATSLRRKVTMAQANLAAEVVVVPAPEVLRGLMERVALGLARVGDPAQAARAIRRVCGEAQMRGLEERMAGVTTPPAMFKYEQMLLEAWSTGQAMLD